MRKSFVVLLAAALAIASALAPVLARDNRGSDRGYSYDKRYNHDRYYPPRGYKVPVLPRGYYTARYRGSPYYYHGGIWYRPYGPRFVVVAPPLGVVVPFLPPFYTTVWFGGFPYYYADNAYYRWAPAERGYVVSQPPGGPDAGATTQPDYEDIFVYPTRGQSERQQSSDRYECHHWAVEQTGFDPTQSLGGVSAAQAVAKRDDYQRAETACLEARGYSVR
jgi:hypothetical protein